MWLPGGHFSFLSIVAYASYRVGVGRQAKSRQGVHRGSLLVPAHPRATLGRVRTGGGDPAGLRTWGLRQDDFARVSGAGANAIDRRLETG